MIGLGTSLTHSTSAVSLRRPRPRRRRGPRPPRGRGSAQPGGDAGARAPRPRHLNRTPRGPGASATGSRHPRRILPSVPQGRAAVSLTQTSLDGVLSGMRSLIGRIDEARPRRRAPAMRVVPTLDKLLEFAGTEGSKHVAPAGFGPRRDPTNSSGTGPAPVPDRGTLLPRSGRGRSPRPGTGGLHSLGRAIDISPRMDIFDWLAGTYPGSRRAHLLAGRGRQILPGLAPWRRGTDRRGPLGPLSIGAFSTPGGTRAHDGPTTAPSGPERVVGPGDSSFPWSCTFT